MTPSLWALTMRDEFVVEGASPPVYEALEKWVWEQWKLEERVANPTRKADPEKAGKLLLELIQTIEGLVIPVWFRETPYQNSGNAPLLSVMRDLDPEDWAEPYQPPRPAPEPINLDLLRA